MSFSMNVKDEISKVDVNRTEGISELSAIVRNSGSIDNGLKISVENNSVARRIFKLFKDIYDINLNITVRRRYGFSNNLIYIFSLNNKYMDILKDLSIMDNNSKYLDVPHEYLISDSEDMRSYLRGLIMTCG